MNYCIVLCFWFVFSSCQIHDQEIESDECLPATVLFVYIGEANKPIYPLLFRTSISDTTYLQFFGGGKSKFDKFGFDIPKHYMKSTHISAVEYNKMKNFIKNRNTNRDKNLHGASQSTFKVILSDKCEFIMYTIEKEHFGFFSDLRRSLNIKTNPSLGESIRYYEEIQGSGN